MAKAQCSMGLGDGRREEAGEDPMGGTREGAALDNGLTQSQEANKVINISTLRCSLENCNIIKGCQGGCIALAYRNVPLRVHSLAQAVLALGSPIRCDLISRPLTGTKISRSQGV